MSIVERFDICCVRLNEPEAGSCIQGGIRPAIVISNDMCNKHSPVVTVVPLTSRTKRRLPTHVTVYGYGLACMSTAICEQLTTIDKGQIMRKIGHISHKGVQIAIDRAISTQIAV